ncbi:MAG TPA: DUF5808 domain-containing protein [Holophagaceae bacterium]|nr:DUF5808 domain-containing protein [Holophagaceae bacterium]
MNEPGEPLDRAPLLAKWDLLPAAGLASVWLWLQHWLPLLPDHIPSHWNAAGAVNGWMDKERFLAFAALPALGLWGLLFLVGLVLRMGPSPRQQMGARALLPMRGLLPMGFAVMAGICAPMAAFRGGQAIALGVGLLVLCLILGFIPMIRLARLAPPIPGARESDYRWGGLVYWNAQDPRLLVPKRLGLGWTFNFGRPAAWAVLALLLLPAFGIAAAIILLKR